MSTVESGNSLFDIFTFPFSLVFEGIFGNAVQTAGTVMGADESVAKAGGNQFMSPQ